MWLLFSYCTWIDSLGLSSSIAPLAMLEQLFNLSWNFQAQQVGGSELFLAQLVSYFKSLSLDLILLPTGISLQDCNLPHLWDLGCLVSCDLFLFIVDGKWYANLIESQFDVPTKVVTSAREYLLPYVNSWLVTWDFCRFDGTLFWVIRILLARPILEGEITVSCNSFSCQFWGPRWVSKPKVLKKPSWE